MEGKPDEKTKGERIQAGLPLEIQQHIFHSLEELDPAMADELRSDFDIYVGIESEMMNAVPFVSYTLSDIEKRTPNNRWINLMKALNKGKGMSIN
jgi:hypothetical protein